MRSVTEILTPVGDNDILGRKVDHHTRATPAQVQRVVRPG